MFTKYGLSTLIIFLFFSFSITIAALFINNNFIKIPFLLFGVLLAIFTLNFFRDPERRIPEKDKIVVSPADGRVLFVKEVDGSEVIGVKGLQISIFMSPLNVNVNRIPIDGVVQHVKYHPGKYLVAYDDKASKENERSEFVIESKYGKVFFSQIAGYVARKIVYDLQKGDRVKMGERFGMIKFGSRVDVVVPSSWKTKLKKDDIVKAGETILFEIPEEN